MVVNVAKTGENIYSESTDSTNPGLTKENFYSNENQKISPTVVWLNDAAFVVQTWEPGDILIWRFSRGT